MQKALLLSLLSFLLSFQLQSQTISGSIRDASTGETLPGASISIKGTTLGSTADAYGNYQINNVPKGKQTLVISFIGYHNLEQEINVISSITYKQNFKIITSTEELSEFVIYERASGQVEALSNQKNAENIKNVVSEEQIISFPDLNAADAMQRIPGVTLQRDQGDGRYVQLRGTPPELTNFNVNGIQLPSPESSIRTVGMDVFNASQIQTIEIAKVLTPDMNADAIGGSVNLITKKAENIEPQFNVVAAGGYNDLRQTGNGELQFTFSQRKNRIGFLVNSNYINSVQGSDNMEFDYEKGPFFGAQTDDNFFVQYNEVQLRHYDIQRERIGLSATLDYQIDEKNELYISGMYNRYSDDETRLRKVYTLDDATSERNYLFGGIEHDVRDRVQIQTISMTNFGGKHDLGLLKLNYELAYSVATEIEPNYMEAVFDNPGQAIEIGFNRDEPDFPVAFIGNQAGAELATDYENYELDQLLFEENQSTDENIIGRVDIEIPAEFLGHKGIFKFGTLQRTKDKSRDIDAKSYGAYREESRLYVLDGPPLNVAAVSDGFEDRNFLDREYELEFMPDPQLMRDFYNRYPTLFIYGDAGLTETLERTISQDYTATEDVQAYYAMTRFDINKLMVLAGVRYERTDISYEGFQVLKTSSGFFESLDTIQDQRIIDFLLPNLQFKYSLNNNLNIRAAATYTYARPNFRDVIPYRIQNERNEVRFGNPDLDYPLALNLDLLGEYYWKGRNIISGGLFYKQIDDFIFNYQIFGYEGDPREANFNKIEIELPLNGIDAFVRGAEVQVQAFFNRLPGNWKNIGVLANYTYTNSEGVIGKRFEATDNINIIRVGEDYEQFFDSTQTEKIPLPGQAPNSLNLSLFYDSPKWYFKVATAYNDVFLHTLGADPDLDEYYGNLWRVDMNGYYQVNEVLQVFGDIRNVTNQPLRFYLGDPSNERILQTEFYSFSVRLGVRLRF